MNDIQHSESLSYSVRSQPQLKGPQALTVKPISQCVHIGPIFYATNGSIPTALLQRLYSNVPRRPLPLPFVCGGVEEIRCARLRIEETHPLLRPFQFVGGEYLNHAFRAYLGCIQGVQRVFRGCLEVCQVYIWCVYGVYTYITGVHRCKYGNEGYIKGKYKD